MSLARGEVRANGKTYTFSPFSEIAARLLSSRGLGNLVRETLRAEADPDGDLRMS